MSFLIATAGATNSNSNLTVARADEILGQRLYATKWDAAGTTPSADGYLTNATASIGATSVAVDTGTGTFTAGCKIKFDSHNTIYTVSAVLSAAGTLTFTPALTGALLNNEGIERKTGNDKEKSLIWATTLFDELMEWFGGKRDALQRLRFPRYGLVTPDGFSYDSTTIPELLEVATAEFALVLLERNKFKLPSILGQGVSSVRLGPLSADIDAAQQEDVIPRNILAMLAPLGVLSPAANVTGAKIVKLYRA